MKLRDCLSLFLLLALLPLAPAQQTVTRGRLVDEDYRFALTAPGSTWRLLEEDAAVELAPDSVAGLAGTGRAEGVFLFVVIEYVPDLGEDAYADLVVEAMPVEGKRELRRVRSEIGGRSALRVDVDAHVGLPLRYSLFIVERGEYLTQVIVFGKQSLMAPDRLLDEAIGGVQFLDGEPRERLRDAVVKDAHGVGWLVEDGRFSSLPYELDVDPPAGVRPVFGSELQGMSSDAELGLISSAPDIYLTLTVEAARGESAQAMLESVRPEPVPDPLELEVLGGPRTFHPLEELSAEMPFDFLQATWLERGRLYQCVAWFSSGARDAALARLPELLRPIHHLDAERAAEVRRRLAELPDPDGALTATQALYGGTFVDFERGFSWSKPAQGPWRVFAGDHLVLVEEQDSDLFVDLRGHGLTARIYADDFTEAEDADQYHELTVEYQAEGLEMLRRWGTRRLGRGEGAVRVTEFDVVLEGMTFRFVVGTAWREGLGLDFILSGLRTHVADEAEQVEAALAGLRLFDAAPRMVEHSPRRFVDRRVGVECSLPRGWRVVEEELNDEAALARLLSFHEKDEVRMHVLVLHPPAVDGSALQRMEDHLEGTLQRTSTGYGSLGEWEDGRFGALTTRRAPIKRLLGTRGEVHAFQRDVRYIAVTLIGSERERAASAELLRFLSDPLEGLDR